VPLGTHTLTARRLWSRDASVLLRSCSSRAAYARSATDAAHSLRCQ
jgi:hypothetical protein